MHNGLRETWGRCCCCSQGSCHSWLMMSAAAAVEPQMHTAVRAACRPNLQHIATATLLACRSTCHYALSMRGFSALRAMRKYTHASSSERTYSLRIPTLWRMTSLSLCSLAFTQCMAVKAQPRPTHPAGTGGQRGRPLDGVSGSRRRRRSARRRCATARPDRRYWMSLSALCADLALCARAPHTAGL